MGTAVSMEGSFLLNLPLGELVWALLFLISNSSNQVWESRTQRFLPAKTWLPREWDRRTPKLMTSSTSLVLHACTWRKGLLIVHSKKQCWITLAEIRLLQSLSLFYFSLPSLQGKKKRSPLVPMLALALLFQAGSAEMPAEITQSRFSPCASCCLQGAKFWLTDWTRLCQGISSLSENWAKKISVWP